MKGLFSADTKRIMLVHSNLFPISDKQKRYISTRNVHNVRLAFWAKCTGAYSMEFITSHSLHDLFTKFPLWKEVFYVCVPFRFFTFSQRCFQSKIQCSVHSKSTAYFRFLFYLFCATWVLRMENQFDVTQKDYRKTFSASFFRALQPIRPTDTHTQFV